MSKYHDNLKFCGSRYKTMTMVSLDQNLIDKDKGIELLSFIEEFIEKSRDYTFPLNKLNRWLGYIQGCLIYADITTVEDERNWTRPLFRPLDFE